MLAVLRIHVLLPVGMERGIVPLLARPLSHTTLARPRSFIQPSMRGDRYRLSKEPVGSSRLMIPPPPTHTVEVEGIICLPLLGSGNEKLRGTWTVPGVGRFQVVFTNS